MAKVFGPCLSTSASGSVKKTITFQKRPSGFAAMGRPVSPVGKLENPTAAQTVQRAKIKNLVEKWQAFSAAQKAQWQAQADWVGRQLSGYHEFMRAGTGLPVPVLLDVLGYYEGDPQKRNFLLGSGVLI